MLTPEDIINERKSTHGDFADTARLAQALKYAVQLEIRQRASRDQPPLSHEAVEALDLIATKIGRILAGSWDHPDHWDDIAGYAKLVAQEISRPRDTNLCRRDMSAQD